MSSSRTLPSEQKIYSRKLPSGTDKKLGLFRQFADINEMFKEAIKYVPAKATVYIFPYGGVTYPK